MNPLINETHDINLESWVESANGHPVFPIQNLPFAVVRQLKSSGAFHGAVAIGEYVIDLSKLHQFNLLKGEAQVALSYACQSTLNELMALPVTYHHALRKGLSRLLKRGAAEQSKVSECLIPNYEIEYKMPCIVGDYTDFYTSIYHATSVGKLFRPDNPLLPNYKWVPIGYHGRASSIDISGQSFPRPFGQLKAPDSDAPILAPCDRLDYEVEMGVFIGANQNTNAAIQIEDADNHIFGLCLLNDWSARDIQAWEYQPLGPFLAKNFATTISPWIVTLEALAPFRAPFSHPKNDPQPLPYLTSSFNQAYGGLDIQLDCFIQTESMKADGQKHKLSSANFKDAYWTIAQLVTHHTVNGCPLNSGDLLGSGTQSGPSPVEAGSLLELTKGGKECIQLCNGEIRKFLEDGDSIIMSARCQKHGAASIGFGEVVGTVLPALKLSMPTTHN